ncbi:hypothetical protein Sste5344_002457 [Sporothrix stenoceras]
MTAPAHSFVFAFNTSRNAASASCSLSQTGSPLALDCPTKAPSTSSPVSAGRPAAARSRSLFFRSRPVSVYFGQDLGDMWPAGGLVEVEGPGKARSFVVVDAFDIRLGKDGLQCQIQSVGVVNGQRFARSKGATMSMGGVTQQNNTTMPSTSAGAFHTTSWKWPVTGSFSLTQKLHVTPKPSEPVMSDKVWHTSNWPAGVTLDTLAGQRVAVIGNGASGVQVVPNIQPIVARLGHYARNPTWIADAYTRDNERTLAPQPIPINVLQSFLNDESREAYLAYRNEVEAPYWRRFDALFRDRPANDEARAQYKAVMAKRAPPFSIVGRDGVDLREAWAPGGLYGGSYSYLGVATPGFPNLFFLAGPHSSGPPSTVPSVVEHNVVYFAKMLRKIASQSIRTIAPLTQAANDFVAYADAWFPRTYLTDTCTHERYVRFDPRREDFEFTYMSGSGNWFAWLRNGWTAKEQDPETDLTWYLKRPADVDSKSWYKNWYDLW